MKTYTLIPWSLLCCSKVGKMSLRLRFAGFVNPGSLGGKVPDGNTVVWIRKEDWTM